MKKSHLLKKEWFPSFLYPYCYHKTPFMSRWCEIVGRRSFWSISHGSPHRMPLLGKGASGRERTELCHCQTVSAILFSSQMRWWWICKLGFSLSQNKEGNQWASVPPALKPNSTLNLGLRQNYCQSKSKNCPSYGYFSQFLWNSSYSLDQKFLVMTANATLL